MSTNFNVIKKPLKIFIHCDGLILNGYEHYRVFHCENEFAGGKSHVNGIESFLSDAKHRLAKFNGCKSDKFGIHLKETEFRFNH